MSFISLLAGLIGGRAVIGALTGNKQKAPAPTGATVAPVGATVAPITASTLLQKAKRKKGRRATMLTNQQDLGMAKLGTSKLLGGG